MPRGAGCRVLLCEQDDLAAHTSSASTKLIHGGLRYLEEFHFALVRKALHGARGAAALPRRTSCARCISSCRMRRTCARRG